MQISYDGNAIVDRTQLDIDIRDLEIGVVGGATVLYGTTGPAGGLVAYSISPTNGLLQAFDFQFFTGSAGDGSGGFAELIDINGQKQLLFGGDASDGVLSFGVGGNGILTQLTSGLDLSGPVDRLSDVVGTTIGGDSVLYVADADLGRITVYSQSGSASYSSIDFENVGQGDFKLALTQSGGSQFLISTDLEANHIAAYRVDAQGRLTETHTMGAADGLGVSNPTAVEVVEAFGQSWVILGAAGSGSLSVMRLTSQGNLIPSDHVLDTRNTRFDDVVALKTVSANGWTFVIAGGADDGMTIFTLTPTGRLVHLDTLAHDTGLGLQNVTALEAVAVGNEIQIFATSGTSEGVSQFSVSLAQLGGIVAGTGALSGTANDDLIVTGDGTTSAFGGAGADIFAVDYFDKTVRIEDFEVGVDTLDLSAFPLLYDPSRLSVTETANGITLDYGVATVEVLSSNGQPLTLDDLFPNGFEWANHLPILVDLPDTDGANVIEGSAGNDMLNGTGGVDSISGGNGDDTLNAGAGDDILSGGRGNDRLDGSSGIDTKQYFQSSENYMMLRSGNLTVVIDQTGNDGNDAVFNVENLTFTDKTIETASVINFDTLAYIASYADLRASLGTDRAAGLTHYLLDGQDAGRVVTFNSLEYLASHSELRAIYGANADAGAQHYILFGADAGRNVTFSGLEYIASHADLRAAYGTNASAGAQHYILFGENAGRQVTFDGLEYIASYSDLRATFGTNSDAGTAHYILFGANAGRQATFDGLEYIASYADLRAIYGTNGGAGTAHYILFGANAGRKATFDGLEYIASYADLRALYGTNAEAGAVHYILFGANAGRQTTFDGLEYIASYTDLRDSIGTNAEAGTLHFIETGADEGRTVTFDGYAYLATYVDLLNVFGADAEAATAHYIISGADAGRKPDSRDGLDEITAGQTGTGAANTLTGGAEAELLAGMGGNDTLSGGAADDVLFGGAGSDTFVFVDGFDNDKIVDFNTLDDNEKIDLSGVTEITDFADLASNHITTIDGVVTITDGINTIALNGVTLSNLDVDDFVFF